MSDFHVSKVAELNISKIFLDDHELSKTIKLQTTQLVVVYLVLQIQQLDEVHSDFAT